MSMRVIEFLLVAAVLALLATVGVPLGWDWWRVDRRVQTTDDASVQGDLRMLAAKVPGYVAAVLVQDFQMVDAGQPLLRIEDNDYHAKVAQAEAVVQARQAAVDHIGAQLRQQQDVIAQARAQHEATQANLDLASVQLERARSLRKTTFGTQEALDEARAAHLAHRAALKSSAASIQEAEGHLPVLAAQQRQAEAELDQARAATELARIDLGHTVIRAPVRGQLGKRAVFEGQYVGVGAGIITLVPLDSVWINANFKETQLGRVRPGQPVTITVDSFPGAKVRGHVAALASASGAATALLPPDNATGNFTKIVQRIPLKVVIEPKQELVGRLLPGMSAVVAVDTAPDAEPLPLIERLLALLGLGDRQAHADPRQR